MADGTRLEGDQLTDWYGAQPQPKLDGHPLFDPGNSLRWLRDRTLRPDEAPVPLVELTGGDCLPGVVTGFRQDAPFFNPISPHFLVTPLVNVTRPGVASRLTQVRVLERFVRRIVWQPRGTTAGRLPPGTVLLADGRALKFRSAFFGDGSVRLLRDEGVVERAFADLAEIHLPHREPWGGYFDELALSGSDAAAPRIQLETTRGLVVTAAQHRCLAEAEPDAANSDNGWYAVAPAWSLDSFWVAHRDIWIRRVFEPRQVPLARITPLGDGVTDPTTWRSNRNAYGGRLSSGGVEYGWGFGVHAPLELHVPLPEMAIAFRTAVGLDDKAGTGGCARGRILVGSAANTPLYESPPLIGSQTVLDTGWLSLPARNGVQPLILQADDFHAGRPKGADPLDIRDLVDWLDPTVQLDPTRLAAEVRRRMGDQVPAWKDWVVELDPPGTCTLDGRLGQTTAVDDFRGTAVRSLGAPLKLTRQLQVDPGNRWLLLFVSRQLDSTVSAPVSEIEILVDGESLAKASVPAAGSPPPSPLAFDLSPYDGRQIKLCVAQAPVDPSLPPVEWRAALVVDRCPLVRQVFDESEVFLDAQAGGQVTPESSELAYTGRNLVKVPQGGRFTLALPEPIRVRENPQWDEQRFLRFAVRKAGGGHVCLEVQHDKSPERDFAVRYDAGRERPEGPTADFVWFDDEPPAGASPLGTEGTESWRWVSAGEGPVFSGKSAMVREREGYSQQHFLGTTAPLPIHAGDKLFVYVYLDPQKPPRQLMVEFNDGHWGHRAYWGEGLIAYGAEGTFGKVRVGPLPTPGQWVRLEVDAARVGLWPGSLVNGWAVTQVDGKVWWDKAGKNGPGDPAYGVARRVWRHRLLDQWIVVTRDLYADFGQMDVTGLTLHVPDGEYALFDHVYLARTVEDFSLIRTAPSPEAVNDSALRALTRAALDLGLPATVAVEVAGRRGSGVLLGNEGWVLTAGHLLVGDVKDVSVTLADGTPRKGRTAGICRDLDCGLVQLEGSPPAPGVELSEPQTIRLPGGSVTPARRSRYHGCNPTAAAVRLSQHPRGTRQRSADLRPTAAHPARLALVRRRRPVARHPYPAEPRGRPPLHEGLVPGRAVAEDEARRCLGQVVSRHGPDVRRGDHDHRRRRKREFRDPRFSGGGNRHSTGRPDPGSPRQTGRRPVWPVSRSGRHGPRSGSHRQVETRRSAAFTNRTRDTSGPVNNRPHGPFQFRSALAPLVAALALFVAALARVRSSGVPFCSCTRQSAVFGRPRSGERSYKTSVTIKVGGGQR